jgi:hypothetical protein
LNRGGVKIGRLRIRADRWPWDRSLYGPGRNGWGKVPGWGRFGGGWNWKLGIAIGGSTVMVDLIFGMVTFSMEKRS